MSLALGKNTANSKQPLHLDNSNHLLVNDSVNKAVLETIATNTANINVNVGDVEINVADLEALQQTTINHLDGVIGHINNTNAIGSGQNVVKSMSLGYDRGNDTGVAILVDSLGHIQTDIVSTALPTGAATETTLAAAEIHVGNIDGKITACNTGAVVISSSALPSGAATSALQGDIESSLNSLISANHTDLVALETTLTAIETDQAAIEVLLTSANTDHAANEALLTTIDADTDAIKTNTAACATDLAALEILQTSTNSKLDTMIGHNDGVETLLTAIDGRVDGLETLQGAANTDLAAIEVLLTSANTDHAANEALLTTIDADTDAIKNSTAACATDLAAIEVLLTSANTDHAANEVLLTTIDADTDAIKTNTAACATDLAALEILQTATNSKLDTMIGHNDGVETLLTAIDGRVDGLETLQGAANTDLAAIEVLLTSANTDHAANEVLLTNAEAHLGNIDTGIDVLEACVGSNKVNVNISSGNITGFATQTTLAAAEVHLGNIETAVQLIDDAIKTEDLAHSSGDKGIPCLMVRQDSHTDLAADGDYMIPTINANGEIRVTSTAASGGATEAKQDDMETTLDAILAKNTEIETTNNANQVLLGTIDSDTDAIKTSAAALVVDLAAIEVLITAGNALTTTIDGVLDNILTKNGEIETTNNANQVLLGTIDSDTDAIKTSAAALVVDLAAIEVLVTAGNALLTTIDSDTNDIKTATELASGARIHTHLNFGDIAVGGGAAETLPAGTGLTLNNSSAKLGYVCSAEVDADYQFIIQNGLTDAGGTTTFVDHVVSGSTNLNSGTREISGVIDKIGRFARVKILNTSASGTQSFNVNLFQ